MSGFVYIWRDKKHNRFYIGSHWGKEDDGYVCSSSWMKKAYNRRPEDFKRRILQYEEKSRKILLEEETKWIGLIKDNEFGKRYYNLKRGKQHNWHGDEGKSLTIAEKISNTLKGRKLTPESIEKRSAKIRGRKHSEETIKKMRAAALGKVKSEEHRKNLSLANIGKKYSKEVNMKKAVKYTDAMKAQRSEALKKAWERKKGLDPLVRLDEAHREQGS